MNVRGALEAILFVAEAPVPIEELAEVLELSRAQVEEELAALVSEGVARGVGIGPAPDGWGLAAL